MSSWYDQNNNNKKTKTILFLWANFVVDGNMFGKGDGFPLQCRNTHMERFSCNDVVRLSSGEHFPGMLFECVKLLSGPCFVAFYSS